MTRKEIEKAARIAGEGVIDRGWWREFEAVEFACQQVNAALEEAEAAVRNMPFGNGGGYDRAVNEALGLIRALKIAEIEGQIAREILALDLK